MGTLARVAIFARTPPKIYSGGRYLSWTMAEALALAGHDTTYITDHRPPCAADFADAPAHDTIQLHLTRDFGSDLPKEPFDVIVLIPGMDRSPELYEKAYRRVVTDEARFVFHNFETPNWFNRLSPTPRDPELWRHWLEYGSRADLLLSMTAEAETFAREFYRIGEDGPDLRSLHPCINSPAADAIGVADRERRIVVFCRFVQAEHKGSRHLHKVLSPAMKGHTLVLLIGNGTIPADQLEALEEAAAANGARVEVSHAINDADKFRELKRASLMIFPSLFEGYGLPPVEAQYCDLPCIAFDLPVLREVSGDGLVYCEAGNWDALRRAVEDHLLGRSAAATDLRGRISDTAQLSSYAHRLSDIIEGARARPRRPPREPDAPSRSGRLRDWLRNLYWKRPNRDVRRCP